MLGKITMHKSRYERTKSAKNFSTIPTESTTQVVTESFYKNYIDSISFFNNFGYGASCRGYKNYTLNGYIITKVVTISPYHLEKIVTVFTFDEV